MGAPNIRCSLFEVIMYIIQELIGDGIWKQLSQCFDDYNRAKDRLDFYRRSFGSHKYRMVKLAIEIVE